MQLLAHLPNALSSLRIAAVPALVALAAAGQGLLFLGGFALALATDVADGFAARRLGVQSELGARLDSWGDWLLYAALPLCAWWLWPDVLRAEAAAVATALVAFLAPTAVGWLKFGRLTSYHTRLAKLSAWLVGPGAIALLAWDLPGPFRVAVAVLVLAALEEIAITAVLPAWRADVPSLGHALRSSAEPGREPRA